MVALHLGTWPQWLKVVFRFQQHIHFMEAQTDICCKIYTYLYYSVCTLSVWILVVVTIERGLAVYKPMYSKIMCTKRNSRLLLSAIFFCILLAFMPVPLYFYARRSVRFGQNDGDVDVYGYCASPHLIFIYMDTTIRIIVPFIILLFCNITIIRVLFKANKKRKRLSAINSDQQADNEQKELQFLSIILLTASFAHICLTLPIMFQLGIHSFEVYKYWGALFLCLLYLNQSVNFLLYCISGKRVRRELLEMLSELGWKIKRNFTQKPADGTSSSQMTTSSTVEIVTKSKESDV